MTAPASQRLIVAAAIGVCAAGAVCAAAWFLVPRFLPTEVAAYSPWLRPAVRACRHDPQQLGMVLQRLGEGALRADGEELFALWLEHPGSASIVEPLAERDGPGWHHVVRIANDGERLSRDAALTALLERDGDAIVRALARRSAPCDVLEREREIGWITLAAYKQPALRPALLPLLLVFLDDDSPTVVAHAAATAAHHGAVAMARFDELLGGQIEPWRREALANALGVPGDASALHLLERCLAGMPADRRWRLTMPLAMHDDDRALPDAVTAWPTLTPDERCEVLRGLSLARHGARARAMVALLAVVDDPVTSGELATALTSILYHRRLDGPTFFALLTGTTGGTPQRAEACRAALDLAALTDEQEALAASPR